MSTYWPRGATGDPRQLPELRRALVEFAAQDGPWAEAEQVRAMRSITGAGGGKLDEQDTQFEVMSGPKGYNREELGAAIQQAAMRAKDGMRWSREMLERAQLMHVSAELCDILYASADTIPDDVVLSPDMLPTPIGFCVFETPFIGIDAGDEHDEVRVDAFMWGPVRFPPRDDWLSHTVAHDGFGFAAFRYMDPEHQDDAAASEAIAMRRMWIPLGRADWVVGDRVDRTPHDGIIPGSPQDMSMREDRKLISALWAIVQQKLVVERTRIQAPKAARKRLARKGDTADPAVEVVHLRRPEYKGRNEDGGSEHRYGVRWAVRPHWRNQAWGPKMSKRKLILVPPHMKGDPDAPVKNIERVWSVDR